MYWKPNSPLLFCRGVSFWPQSYLLIVIWKIHDWRGNEYYIGIIWLYWCILSYTSTLLRWCDLSNGSILNSAPCWQFSMRDSWRATTWVKSRDRRRSKQILQSIHTQRSLGTLNSSFLRVSLRVLGAFHLSWDSRGRAEFTLALGEVEIDFGDSCTKHEAWGEEAGSSGSLNW